MNKTNSPENMKRITLLIGFAVLACAVGVWLGRATTSERPINIHREVVFVTCGAGDYPKEAYEWVNDEIPAKLYTLLGENAHLQYLVVVTPETSGYRVAMAGLAGSKLWGEEVQKELSEWIDKRMNSIQLKTPIKDQSGTGQSPSPLVAHIEGGEGGTLLEFRTDRPLHEARVVANGKTVGSLSLPVGDSQTTLKLFVSERQNRVAFHLATANHFDDFTAAYPPVIDARDGAMQHFAPEKDVKLPESGWVEVYRLTARRYYLTNKTQYELKVEIQ